MSLRKIGAHETRWVPDGGVVCGLAQPRDPLKLSPELGCPKRQRRDPLPPISLQVTFNIPPNLEAQIRDLARREGRDVQSLIDEALASLAQRAVKNGSGIHDSSVGEVAPFEALRGSVVRYDDPYAPSTEESEWEALE